MQIQIAANYLELNQALVKIANGLATTIAESFHNRDQINETTTLRLTKRDMPIVLNLHREAAIDDCFADPNRTFTVTANGTKILSGKNYFKFNQIISSLSAYLDKLINQNSDSKLKSTIFKKIIETALDPARLKEFKKLSESLNINAAEIPGYQNLLTTILVKLFNPEAIEDIDFLQGLSKEQLEDLAVKLLDHGGIPLQYSPMESAIKGGHIKIVEALIKNGFGLEAKYPCTIGRLKGNLLDLAKAHGQSEIAKMLQTELGMKTIADDETSDQIILPREAA